MKKNSGVSLKKRLALPLAFVLIVTFFIPIAVSGETPPEAATYKTGTYHYRTMTGQSGSADELSSAYPAYTNACSCSCGCYPGAYAEPSEVQPITTTGPSTEYICCFTTNNNEVVVNSGCTHYTTFPRFLYPRTTVPVTAILETTADSNALPATTLAQTTIVYESGENGGTGNCVYPVTYSYNDENNLPGGQTEEYTNVIVESTTAGQDLTNGHCCNCANCYCYNSSSLYTTPYRYTTTGRAISEAAPAPDEKAGNTSLATTEHSGADTTAALAVDLLKAAIPGDLDNDSYVTAADARIVLRASADLEDLNEAQIAAANIFSGIEPLSAACARLILRLSCDLEELS